MEIIYYLPYKFTLKAKKDVCKILASVLSQGKPLINVGSPNMKEEYYSCIFGNHQVEIVKWVEMWLYGWERRGWIMGSGGGGKNGLRSGEEVKKERRGKRIFI